MGFQFFSFEKSAHPDDQYSPSKFLYSSWKFKLVMAFVVIAFGMVFSKLVQLQLIKGPEYRERAKRQHESKMAIAASRGNIYDRNGKLLATTIKIISVAVDPTLIEDKNNICTFLAKITNRSKFDFIQKIDQADKKDKSFTWLVRGIEAYKANELKKIKDKGLIIIEESKRLFPYGTIGSQIIGLTDTDNKGIAGIEKAYDSTLIGKNGFIYRYRDARGDLRYAANLPKQEAQNGKNLQLTIDIDLQRVVEAALQRGMDRSQAEAGTVICIRPKTGEILAMASYPVFDPHKPGKTSFSGMRMRGITDTYEPGSTFKMITAAAALQEGICDENTMFEGYGGTATFKSFTIHDVHGMGRVTFRKAMEQSSNIILSEVANRMEDKKFYKYIRDFGFGIPTGIDLPGEVSGRIQKPENFNAGSKRYMGHGYGLSCTALQLVNAYATIANQGNMMKPFIVNKIFDNSTNYFVTINPQKVRSVISPNTATRLANIGVGIVDSGSGKQTIISGLRIAGKTGTSQQIENGQYSKSNYNASFVGFYPAEDPQVAVLALVDRPRGSIYGGTNAAPIFKDVATSLIAMYPEFAKSIQYKNNQIIAKQSDSILVPSINGMQLSEAKKMVATLGLNLKSEASDGLVFSQFPKEGSKVPAKTTINVTVIAMSRAVGVKDSLKKDENMKHNVLGLSMRRAVAILQKSGVYSKVLGQGKVINQTWTKDKNNKLFCTLECK